MAEDVPFISELDLEALLGVNVSSTDLILTIALDSACDAVRSYLGQRVNRVEDDEIALDGSGRDAVRLPERPVREVTTVVVDDVEAEPEEFFVRRALLLRADRDVWPVGRGNIVVTYTHGWDVTAPLDLVVPADIRLVALSLARRIYKAVANAATPQGGLQGETIGAYAYTNASLPPEVAAALAAASALLEPEMEVLDPYRVTGPASGSRS